MREVMQDGVIFSAHIARNIAVDNAKTRDSESTQGTAARAKYDGASLK